MGLEGSVRLPNRPIQPRGLVGGLPRFGEGFKSADQPPRGADKVVRARLGRQPGQCRIDGCFERLDIVTLGRRRDRTQSRVDGLRRGVVPLCGFQSTATRQQVTHLPLGIGGLAQRRLRIELPVRELLKAPLVPRGALLEDQRDVGNLDQIAAFGIEEGTGLRAIEQRRGLAIGRHDRRHAGALGSQFLQVRAPRVELIDERLQGRRLVPRRAETLNLRGRRLDLAGRTFEALGKLPASGRGIRCSTAGAFGSRPSHREATVQRLDGFRRLCLRRGGGGKLRESIRGRLSLLQRLPRLVPRKVGAGFSLLQQ